MTSRRIRMAVSALAAVALTSGVIAGLSTPAAAEEAAGQAAKKHCAVLVGKAPADVTKDSPVLAEHCSSVSLNDARANLDTSRLPAGTAATALIRIWQNTGYGGADYLFLGAYGTCDSAGYRLRPPTVWWEKNVSSVSKFGRCNIGRFTTRGGTYSRTIVLPEGNILDPLNDNVGRIHVYYRP